MLEIQKLAKRHARIEVLRDLDLTVADATFTAILGPSGSGKTTLLRVIAGFEHADSGSVKLSGQVVDDASTFVDPEHRRIGYVPQEGGLFPHLSISANVGFGLPRANRRGIAVDELLEMVGLGGMGARYPQQLSGGQQQRVALARALAIQPSLILLDEPFSSLDANLRQSLRQDVRHVLREMGATAILVTHDQDEALSFADHVAILEDGRIAQHDTPRALYSHPISPALAQTLGEGNFLTGTGRAGMVTTALGKIQLETRSAALEGDVTVLVRPEQISLSKSEGTTPSIGKVVDSVFYGHDLVIRVELHDGGPIISVRRPGVEGDIAIGSEVGLVVLGDVASWRRDQQFD